MEIEEHGVTLDQGWAITGRVLAGYTTAEGAAEELARLYLEQSPAKEVLQTLLVPRPPLPGDIIGRMLRQVVIHEGQSPDLIAEWSWATEVRNDLAHTTGEPAHIGGYRPLDEFDGWQLSARPGSRYQLQTLKEPIPIQDFSQLAERMSRLSGALWKLVALVEKRGTAS